VVAVHAADVDSDKPRRAQSVSTKKPVKMLKPNHFMPRHRVIIVPKGDPRARPPTEFPTALPSVPVANPFSAGPMQSTSSSVLRASATSAACAAKKGVCKASSSCTGSVVRGICAGAATITCCVPKGTSPSTPSAPSGACPVYSNAPTSQIAGNGNVKYNVVRIAAQHFSGSADNTMTKPTACAFAQMAEAAKKAGIRLTINSGFRTLARQQYFWNCYQTKKCNNGNLAARPGNSNHGRGVALDINTGPTSTATYKWMAANAARYGFRRTVPSEPWHWEH